MLAYTPYRTLGNVTSRIERIRHCLIPIVGNKTRAFLSLVVTIVVLEVIDPPAGERLGVLFLPSQRCSFSVSVFVTAVEILIRISYRIARKCMSQLTNTSPIQAPYHEPFLQLLGFHLGTW